MISRTLRRIARRAAIAVAPRAMHRISAARERRADEEANARRTRIAAALTPGGKDAFVASGPFRGLRYVTSTGGSASLPKLVGSYEDELAGVLELLIRRGFRTVINVGCGEGYYAVGLATRLPVATVYAFDIDAESRAACARLAAANSVSDRVVIAADASERLAAGCDADTLVICDCEGCEVDIFSEAVIERIREATILVELHDFLNPAISGMMAARFGRTHALAFVATRPRSATAYPSLRALPVEDQRFALDEGRPGHQEWLLCAPKDGARAAL